MSTDRQTETGQRMNYLERKRRRLAEKKVVFLPFPWRLEEKKKVFLAFLTFFTNLFPYDQRFIRRKNNTIINAYVHKKRIKNITNKKILSKEHARQQQYLSN
jgi:hypothetical protein